MKQLTKEQRRDLYRLVFQNVHGQQIIDDMARNIVGRQQYCKGDPHETAYRCGKMDVLRQIIELTEEE